MKCENCGRVWGQQAYPTLVSIVSVRRETPIMGIQYECDHETHKEFLWELCYDNIEEDLDTEEQWYECSQCGENIPSTKIESVVKSYSENQNDAKSMS